MVPLVFYPATLIYLLIPTWHALPLLCSSTW